MANDAVVLERVQELTWALGDEEISDDEMALLDNLLLSDDQSRRRYIECIQLHTDLMAHYATRAAGLTGEAASKSPVLGFLNAGTMPIDLQSPANDATT